MPHPLAGKPAPASSLINIPDVIARYYEGRPDPSSPLQRVNFATLGHRGNPQRNTFNESHVLAIAQAICDYRKSVGNNGPLFLGRDTHALSIPAQMSAIRVFAANGMRVRIAENNAATPTPLISYAILDYNNRYSDLADGVIITPSHNPPSDGGIKYNTSKGGPADTDVTAKIEQRANELLRANLEGVNSIAYDAAMSSKQLKTHDFITPYVEALPQMIDLDAIREANLRIGVDPLGGASLAVYEKINEMHDLGLLFISHEIDPSFSFMTLDHDGKIRMDSTSPYAMAPIIELHEKYDIAFANDPDADRHGIVTRQKGLMHPNEFMSVAIWYLFNNRQLPKKCWWNPFGRCKTWKKSKLQIGKTVVTSAMIDRLAQSFGKSVLEVPVGFKWFAEGLLDETLGFGGEESAGATFLRMDGTVWTTDKDGIVMNLLAAEIRAKTGRDPGEIYTALENEYGKSYYVRIDSNAMPEQKSILKKLTPDDIPTSTIGGEKISAIFIEAPGNSEPLGGVKIVTENGWIAMRPSGTEEIYKIYAESFVSQAHLERLQDEAQNMLLELFARG